MFQNKTLKSELCQQPTEFDFVSEFDSDCDYPNLYSYLIHNIELDMQTQF